MTSTRPISFLDTSALIALAAALLVTAVWMHRSPVLDSFGSVFSADTEQVVADALADDTGL